MEKENPYIAMEDSVFKEHLSQIAAVMEQKQMSSYQFFGESLSPETEQKIAENASLTQTVEKLKSAASATEVSEEGKKLASITIDGLVSEIKNIDENFPVQGIVDAGLSPFQTIDMLKEAKGIASYTQKAVNAVKAEIGESDRKLQGFSSPQEAATEADAIVAKLTKETGIEA